MYRVSYDILLLPEKTADELISWAKTNLAKFQSWGTRECMIEHPLLGEPGRYQLCFIVESIDKWETGLGDIAGAAVFKELSTIVAMEDMYVDVTRVLYNSRAE
ncbi:hypothetical protein J7M23_06255 [Candidatus Sumerlaeota bacterium]|nr:hypothetical protein [Candidatus Sumerlaeota bacterium]